MKKNSIISSYANVAKIFVSIAIGLSVMSVHAAENFLKAGHEQSLKQAKSDEAAASSPSDKALALQQQAASLDSLGKSAEALSTIDRALAMLDPSKSKDLIATKANILFSLNDPQGSLKLLKPELESTRNFAASQPPTERPAALSTYTQGFVTATFDHMQLEQWREAIETLADAQSVFEGSSFYAYKSLIYRYIMARANDPSLANQPLEQQASYYATSDKGHYGALLRMWQGQDTITEISKIIGAMPGAEQQEAFSEALYYNGVYTRFIKGDPITAKGLLETLNRVAPYGSIEWIYGKRVLQ